MKIPRKITPDNLKQTIVQVLYNPLISPELVVGTFNHFLSDTYKFISGPPRPNEIKVTGNDSLVLGSIQRGFFVDKAEQIKVDVGDAGIVFNTYKNYIGWENYFPLISSTIDTLFKINFIKEITRIGIRYVSQFENISLVENLNMEFSLDTINRKMDSTQIRTEYIDETYKVILTLINLKKPVKVDSVHESTSSVIDIDIIQTFDSLDNSQIAVEAINKGHQKQKTTFFSLLRPEFLKTLNPQY